ncbi:hypothetical protein Nepgr_033342 [Nepenthes gracilis]|uniref:RecQ-mediated genome instability protein 1 n=1 Tax=Nepenthes gracilis TaxID=150966 RepID=A0AAD3Y8L0_NEPGR|nr:hypothetical protein Nepgr_033342 [Nepenthes gracilis]
MARRRLRLVDTSSDEDEPQHPQHLQQQNDYHQQQPQHEEMVDGEEIQSIPNIESVTLESDPVQLIVSDEEFIDVSDNLSPPFSPSPPHPPPLAPPVAAAVANSREASDCPVRDILRGLGLNMRREWLDSCIRGLEVGVQGFSGFDAATKAKFCFGEFLSADLNLIGAGVLPENVDSMHGVDLPGPFVLQVDEIVNISCSLRQRYLDAPAGPKRCLKLSMTDGIQRLFGMEYRPIKDLEVLAPAGFKVVIRNVNVRRGLLMLVPEVVEVLGGCVAELEAARQRLVHEVNKPPRGKRSRTGVVPPLQTRATLAAWPPNGVNYMVNTGNSTLQPPDGVSYTVNTENPTFQPPSSFNYSENNGNSTLLPPNGVNDPANISNSTLHSATPFQGTIQGPTLIVTGDETLRTARDSAVPAAREIAEPNLNSSAVQYIEDVDMVDHAEHPFILSGDKELPFTYLASLSAKWAALKEKESFLQGKIKCFLTGVKGFQYKQRSTFELLVYVDDGSLISEILIHHNVVKKGIGYSPEEVTAALSSLDKKRVSEMKETLKQFQIFLVNFEGTMLVEMNGTSSFPIALQMNQGCPASDAWLLLQRMNSPAAGQPSLSRQSDLVALSP